MKNMFFHFELAQECHFKEQNKKQNSTQSDIIITFRILGKRENSLKAFGESEKERDTERKVK